MTVEVEALRHERLTLQRLRVGLEQVDLGTDAAQTCREVLLQRHFLARGVAWVTRGRIESDERTGEGDELIALRLERRADRLLDVGQPHAATLTKPLPFAAMSAAGDSNRLLEEARRLIDGATQHGIVLRLLGGLAIGFLTPELPPRTRAGQDLDFGSVVSNRRALSDLLAERGYEPDRNFNALYGNKQLYFAHPGTGLAVDVLLDSLDERCRENDHFEFFWWPHTEWAQAITNTRTQDPPPTKQRRTGVGAYVNDILLENHAFGMIQRAAQVRRQWIPGLASITARTMSRKEMTDRSDRIFANTRLVRFAEMEYAVPRSELIPAVRDIRDMIERKGLLISFPVEVRAVAPDDIPLSPAYGRETGYIAVHVYHKFEYEPYFREVEAIMNAHDGRPHWGKLHFQTAATLRPRYPMWDRFIAVRNRLDGNRMFGNAYLERVLGDGT